MKYPQLVSMPSAISDWLEEQLEARGIDSVVYTRYILSLLHRDPADVVCHEQDSYLTHSQRELRKSGAARKRLRRSQEFWVCDHTDAEQLKRTAAVECLKSASDQKYGIESLVDELCEKLKEINNSAVTKTESSCNIDSCHESSPQDLVSKYYAAFPPLSKKTSKSPGIITLIPKWIGSPKKRLSRKQSRSASYDEKLHCKVETENMKARIVNKQRMNGFGRNKKDMGYCRNMAKSVEKSDNFNEWELYNIARNRKLSLSKSGSQKIENKPVCAQEQCVTKVDNVCLDEQGNMNLYEDLLDDIRELLSSPEPRDSSVEMMNMANMRDTGIKKFISCGTNITSSIWSTYAPEEKTVSDSYFSDTFALTQPDAPLDLKFSSISIDNNKRDVWSVPDATTTAQNEANMFFESYNAAPNVPWMGKWSEAESYDNENQLNVMARSLMKINHHKDKSSFTEVLPNTARSAFNVFAKGSTTCLFGNVTGKLESEKDKDDLLTSVRSHFRPINEKAEVSTRSYADGTTFMIPNTLDKVNYKRSESGAMYLISEYGALKKYLEYKESDGIWSSSSEFILKFNICQNDKACQTDFSNADIQDEACPIAEAKTERQHFFFPGDEEELLKDDDDQCKCPTDTDRPDSAMDELFWKYECENCNNSTSWGGSCISKGNIWQKQPRDNIWNGELCSSCLGMSGGHQPLNKQQTQLREDISNDGEQLLSDLSSLQKSYMEELPSSEDTYDISDLIGSKDRKRRLSHAADLFEEVVPMGHRGSWSFASRLKEDCLIKMSTIPTLRSVTL